MRPNIYLLSFEGCPNAEEARGNLRKALDTSGYSGIEWEEVDVQGPGVPEGWRGFPSPTILVNGFNVETGERRSDGTSSCRMGGAPEVETIIEGLRRYGRTGQ